MFIRISPLLNYLLKKSQSITELCIIVFFFFCFVFWLKQINRWNEWMKSKIKAVITVHHISVDTSRYTVCFDKYFFILDVESFWTPLRWRSLEKKNQYNVATFNLETGSELLTLVELFPLASTYRHCNNIGQKVHTTPSKCNSWRILNSLLTVRTVTARDMCPCRAERRRWESLPMFS